MYILYIISNKYISMYTLIGLNTKLAPCSVKLSDGKAWWDWQGSCTNFSSSLSPLLVLCKNIWFHQKLLITNTGWSTVMLDTLLDWEAGWISFFKFLTNHDVYIMKFLYVWHFLRQSDIWFIGKKSIHKAYVVQYKSHGTARSQAWSTRWWMGQYGGKTPKPHIAWSNSSEVGFLNRGKLRGWNYKSEEYERNKTCRSYVDKNGVKRFAGKKKELKQSQKLGYQHQELHMFSLGFSKCFTDFTDWSPQRFWKRNGIPFSNKYFMGHTSSTNQQLCFYKTSGYL